MHELRNRLSSLLLSRQHNYLRLYRRGYPDIALPRRSTGLSLRLS